MAAYLAARTRLIAGQRVPDVPGIEAARWRWLSERHGYFEAEGKLDGVEAAPAAYPNGVRLDTPCIRPFQDGLPEEPDELAGVTDAELTAEVRRRGLTVSGEAVPLG